MSKPSSETILSDLFDEDLTWRRRELSDMKSAVRLADYSAKGVLLKAIITMSYAHWEGYVRYCAQRYFEFLTLRKKNYSTLERQIYINTFLNRLDSLSKSKFSLENKCKLVNDILDGVNNNFCFINSSLIDTKSNLNTAAIKEICLICSVDPAHFESSETFLDHILLKRRNAIAHGQYELIKEDEIEELVNKTLALMEHFRTLLENKVYQRAYQNS